MTELRVELHSHTVYSHDGNITFNALQRAAKVRRLDVVCITDHDTVEGARDFQHAAERQGSGPQIVVGEERTLADGSHVIGLFLQGPLLSTRFDDVVEEIAEQNGICVLPHPFRHRNGVLRNDGEVGPEPRRPRWPVAFEIFNPKCSRSENGAAQALLKLGFPAAGGSDAHYASDLGECVNVLPCHGNVETSLRRALQENGAATVLGVHQGAVDTGRQYAPLYYQIKPWLRVPRPLVPVAQRLYSRYRDLAVSRIPELEEKYSI